MSVHIEVDPTVLSVTAGQLRRSVDVAEDFRDQKGSLSRLVDDAGSGRVADAAADFVERWSYGMGLVVDDAQALSERLEAAGAGYAANEDAIAGAMG